VCACGHAWAIVRVRLRVCVCVCVCDCADMEGWLVQGLRVRMGVHVGQTRKVFNGMSLRAEYMGPAVNKAAWITTMSHGGQIVVSQAVYDRIRDSGLAKEKKRLASLGKFDMPDSPQGAAPLTHTPHTAHNHDTTRAGVSLFELLDTQARGSVLPWHDHGGGGLHQRFQPGRRRRQRPPLQAPTSHRDPLLRRRPRRQRRRRRRRAGGVQHGQWGAGRRRSRGADGGVVPGVGQPVPVDHRLRRHQGRAAGGHGVVRPRVPRRLVVFRA
jgi:hypothetical protein